MATLNQAHYGSGGILLFHGELILLFCDGVTVTVSFPDYKETGRLYLTTHRMVFTSKNLDSIFKSLSVPFMSMVQVELEQPVFGANYISVEARREFTLEPRINFKVKFMHGGAIEYGQAMLSAVQMTVRNSSFYQPTMAPPPAYTPSAAQYYQAPPHVYQPAYNCGFPLPNQVFNEAPPAGFVYMSDAPPPYPGLANVSPPQQQQNVSAPQAPGFNNGQNQYPNPNGSAAPPGPSQPGFQAPSYPSQAPPAPGNLGFQNASQVYPSAPPMGKN